MYIGYSCGAFHKTEKMTMMNTQWTYLHLSLSVTVSISFPSYFILCHSIWWKPSTKKNNFFAWKSFVCAYVFFFVLSCAFIVIIMYYIKFALLIRQMKNWTSQLLRTWWYFCHFFTTILKFMQFYRSFLDSIWFEYLVHVYFVFAIKSNILVQQLNDEWIWSRWYRRK